MAFQPINIGTSPNDGTGDPFREVCRKINANLAGLYAIFDDRTAFQAAFVPVLRAVLLSLPTNPDDLGPGEPWNNAGKIEITPEA